MGWAQERVAQIKAKEEAVNIREERATAAKTVVSNNADGLWEMLVLLLEKHTTEFADSLPLAKEKNLRANRLNSNNLTISTQVFPLLHFEIIYTRGAYVDAMIRKIYHGLGEPRNLRLSPIRFTVDHDMQPCFTDGERFLHPNQVAEELMEQVADFFETALKMPKYLA